VPALPRAGPGVPLGDQRLSMADYVKLTGARARRLPPQLANVAYPLTSKRNLVYNPSAFMRFEGMNRISAHPGSAILEPKEDQYLDLQNTSPRQTSLLSVTRSCGLAMLQSWLT